MKLKDLDYKNKLITKPGWKTKKKTRYLKWVNRFYDPIGLYVYESYDNILHEKGFVYDKEELLESEGWEYYEA